MLEAEVKYAAGRLIDTISQLWTIEASKNSVRTASKALVHTAARLQGLRTSKRVHAQYPLAGTYFVRPNPFRQGKLLSLTTC